jgi:hypothetical protein
MLRGKSIALILSYQYYLKRQSHEKVAPCWIPIDIGPDVKALQSNNQQESSSVRGLAGRMPMSPIRQSSHIKLQRQWGMGVQDANRVGAQDSIYPAMSFLYTQHSLQDSKFV